MFSLIFFSAITIMFTLVGINLAIGCFPLLIGGAFAGLEGGLVLGVTFAVMSLVSFVIAYMTSGPMVDAFNTFF